MQKLFAFILLSFWSVFTFSGNNLSAIVTTVQSLLQPVYTTKIHTCCNTEVKSSVHKSGCCLLIKESSGGDANHDSKGCSGNHNDGHDCKHKGNCNRVCCQTISGIWPTAIFSSPLLVMHSITTYPTLSFNYLPNPFIGSDFPPPNLF